MNKKKMCKYATQDCMGLNYKYMFKSCPKNSNHNCEIIPKKPKLKMIKAWVSLHNGKPALIDMVKNGGNSIPCTILIDRKYLKGGK